MGNVHRFRRAKSVSLSAAYAAGSLLLAFLALRYDGFTLVLLWPACSLVVPAVAYAARRPGLFLKGNAGMTLLLAPYLVAAWLNSRLQSVAAAQHVADDVWIGRVSGRYLRNGFRSTVDVTAEFPVRKRDARSLNVPMLDLIAPTPDQLREGVQAIEQLASRRPTVVFCALGRSRSAALAGTWLVTTKRAASVEAAIDAIRAKRSSIVLSAEHRRAMKEAVQ